MTVKRLMALLSKQDPKRTVLLSIDSKGNGFQPVHRVETCAFVNHDGDIEIGLEDLTPALVKLGHTDEDVLADGKSALILWP